MTPEEFELLDNAFAVAALMIYVVLFLGFIL